jgi:hypothetical protein
MGATVKMSAAAASASAVKTATATAAVETTPASTMATAAMLSKGRARYANERDRQ